jgi:hypothetical protein
MDPKQLLRLEGIAVFLAATTAFAWLDGPLAVYLLLALAPDISMLGYLRGPRVGSVTYNAAHTYLAPSALLAVGLWLSATPVAWVALVWTAHVGADRALGYGLMYSIGFGDTHLSGIRDRGRNPIDADSISLVKLFN